MVRSVTIAAVVLVLAWAGFAKAQSSASPQAASSRPHYITVREKGKAPQRCLLLRNWHEANGSPVFQVRAVDTGEVMTIVGASPPGLGGDPRAMSTRIFRWGGSNKPPDGAPLPPPSPTRALAAPHAQPGSPKAIPVTAPQPNRPASRSNVASQFAGIPQSPPATPTIPRVRTAAAPAPSFAADRNRGAPGPLLIPSGPALRTAVPAQPTLASKPPPIITTQRTPSSAPGTPPQPRLVPSADGVADPTCGDCCSHPTCDACCQPCNTCCQPSCACCPPAPPKQSLLSRLFHKSPPACGCTEAACQAAPAPAPAAAPPPVVAPPTAIAKVVTEPAKPRDWRESWGKVEPWKDSKTTTQAAPVKPAEKSVTRRFAPKPVELETPKQPDPLQSPELYRDLAVNARLPNSKIPHEKPPAAPSRPKSRLFAAKRPLESKPPAAAASKKPKEPSPLTPGRGVQLSANEPNAFWSPPEPPKPQKDAGPKYNAFDRDPNNPPKPGVPPRIAPGYSGPMPPRGPMPMVRQQPMMNPPSRPDMGVPSAMGNAFTLPGTRRPIPADFGGTPQEPNGFDPPVKMGQGSPPIPYGPMPSQMAMGPRMPMGANPLMRVPAAPAAPRPMADARPAGVTQLLAKLKDSLYPSERESAVEELSELSWRDRSEVVAGLMAAARDDPAATVRAACVHAMAQMKIDNKEAVALVRKLQSDRDPRVRQEAEEALHTLGDSGIQQASHK